MSNLSIKYILYTSFAACIFSVGGAGPIKQSADAECAVRYQTGASLQYTYTTSLFLNGGQLKRSDGSLQQVGFTLKSDVKLTAVWLKNLDYLLKLEVSAATTSAGHSASEETPLKTLSSNPAYFHWNANGEVRQVFIAANELAISSNIKKGIISAFQLRTVDGERTEMDSSGQCRVKYLVTGDKIQKTKFGCIQVENNSHPLGVSIKSDAEAAFQLADNIIASSHNVETHTLLVNTRQDAQVKVTTRQTLKFATKAVLKKSAAGAAANAADLQSALKLLAKAHKIEFVATTLATNAETLKCTKNCVTGQLTDMIHQSIKSLTLEKLASLDSANTFLTLLPVLRQASKDSVLQAVRKHPNIEMQLIDLAAFAQTDAANEAMMVHLDFGNMYDYSKPERYLSAVSIAGRPIASTLKNLLELYEKNVPSLHLRESIGLALGAALNAFCKFKDQCNLADLQIVQDVERSLSTALSLCTDEACRLRCVGAIRNSRRPQLLSAVLVLAEASTETAVTFAAVQAVVAVEQPCQPSVAIIMNRIYHQTRKKYDSTVRAAALDFMLQRCNVTHQQLLNVFLSTVNQSDFETATFVQSRIADLAEANGELRAQVAAKIGNQRIHNFNSMAPGGKSSSMTNYFGRSAGTSLTYGLRMHNARNGVMKRTAFDLSLSTTASDLRGFQLLATDLYVQGLESLIGSSNDDAANSAEDDVSVKDEPSGGMTLSLADVRLRPIEFFKGSSGLMSAVWSAPSEPVSALAMNVLLQDVSQEMHLHNGLILEASVYGGASINLLGSVSISLWNRDAHCNVLTRGAIALKGFIGIKSNPYFVAGINFHIETESSISLTTDVNFYKSPFKVCSRMSQDAYTVRESWTKYESSSSRSKKLLTKTKRTQKINGASYPLGKQNSGQCTAMLPA